MKKIITLIFLIFSAIFYKNAAAQDAKAEDYPPNAQPGKCYAKCAVADRYERQTEQVLVKEASKKLKVIPPVYETVTEEIVVKEASKKIKVIPAVYETITEQVLVKQESKRLVPVPAKYEMVEETYQYYATDGDNNGANGGAANTSNANGGKKSFKTIPAVYETVTEQVKVSDATTKWVKGKKDKNCLSADPNDCIVWCLVEVPAKYETVTKQSVKSAARVEEYQAQGELRKYKKQVIKEAATVEEEVIPAEYKTVTKTVVKTPAQTIEEIIPEELGTITKTVLKTPEQTIEEEIPAEYRSIEKTVLVSKGGYSEWKEVLCENKVTEATIRNIQAALSAKGYDPGPADNVMGTKTKIALKKYQMDNNLPIGNLDKQTLESLGL